jgi:hypothetical protein
MRDLDNSLLGAANLDESISNANGSNVDYNALALATAAIAGQIIQNRNTPKNEVEQACGVKPLFAGAKKDAWDKCAMNYNTQKTYVPQNIPTANTPQEKTTNWWLVGGGIVGGVAILGTIAYFFFRKK